MEKEQKRKEKVAQAIKDKKIVDDTSFTVFQMIEDMNDRLDSEIPKVTEILTDLIPKIKGDKGDSPTDEELLNLIQPLIPEAIIPKDGENYILTDEDKMEIAMCIPVPIIEKEVETIVEKTETIREIPIVTENVVEKAVTDEPKVIAKKLNTLKEVISPDVIQGFRELERISKLNAFNPTMGPSFSDLANINKRIDNLPTTSGSIGGSIANTQIAFGTAANTIGGSNNLIWDGSKATAISDNNTTLLNTVLALNNTTAATGGVTVQNSPALQFSGNAFVTGANQQQNMFFITEPSTAGPVLRFYGQRGSGSPKVNIASLADSSGNGIFSTQSLQADQSIIASNGGFFELDGTVSGNVQWRANSTTSTYALVWPAAQASVSGQALTNDASGNLSWATPAGTVTTNSTLTGNGSSGTPLGLLLSTSNTWTPSSGTLFQQNAIATTPTDAVLLQNLTTASLAIPVQISPALEFKGAMWQSGSGGSAHVGTFRMYQIPKNGTNAGGVTAGSLQIDSSKDGSYTTNIFSLSNLGILTVANNIVSTNGGLTTQGSITSNGGQVQAASDLLAGANGGLAGHLYLYGGTTGVLNIAAPANVTNYGVTLPATQATVANQTYINDSTGILSWATVPVLPAAPVDLTAQVAAITATTLYTPTTTGMYRISIYLQITTAASISSILGGATGVVLTYNDGDGNVAQTDTVGLTAPNGTVVTTLNTNTTATNLSGSLEIYAKSGVAIQFAIGYTSAGTAMQFAAHLRCEAI